MWSTNPCIAESEKSERGNQFFRGESAITGRRGIFRLRIRQLTSQAFEKLRNDDWPLPSLFCPCVRTGSRCAHRLSETDMLVQGNRPRVLHWYHAGPMLFGDWGTSRLYVLGLAFFFTGRSSIWFMGAMSILLIAVGWAYDVICRHFPEGGGVYSAARQRSENLSVIGGLLLAADYVVTAALSALDAFHYLHLPYPQFWAAAGLHWWASSTTSVRRKRERSRCLLR